MIWPFKSKSAKVLVEVATFDSRLTIALVPLLEKPEKPIAGKGALMSMTVNIALHFLAIRNPQLFEKIASDVIANAIATFASAAAIVSKGNIDVEIAGNVLFKEIQDTRDNYSDALVKSPSNPEGALQECLDIFLDRSGGWAFKGEVERAEAVVALSAELQNLMARFKYIL